MMPGVPVRCTDSAGTAPLPAYAHPGDAGIDLFARVDVLLAPGQRALVPTGIAIALPGGMPRSATPARGWRSVAASPSRARNHRLGLSR